MSSLIESQSRDYWFVYQGDCLIVYQQNDDYTLITDANFPAIKEVSLRHHLIGVYNNKHCYAAEVDATFPLGPTLVALPLRQALQLLGMQWYYAAVRAYCIITWDNNHAYCGRCSKPTVHKPNTFERFCSSCQILMYPRISPSIIVLINRGEEILMARSPHFRPGVFGLIAGFVEAGESLEQAVHREVKEEVGLEIKNLAYFGSQPWPFPDSLMIGFMAEYASGEITPDPSEIEMAGWYHYTNLPPRPSTLSISGRLIEAFTTLHAQQKGQV